jgi:hypothetical protein
MMLLLTYILDGRINTNAGNIESAYMDQDTEFELITLSNTQIDENCIKTKN